MISHNTRYHLESQKNFNLAISACEKEGMSSKSIGIVSSQDIIMQPEIRSFPIILCFFVLF